MEAVETLIQSAKNYRDRKLQADYNFRKAVEKLKDYNGTVRAEKTIILKRKWQDEVSHLKALYADTEQATNLIATKKIKNKFTGVLTVDDLATLDNMDKIELTQSEVEILVEKYQESPLALKRIKRRAKELSLDNMYFFNYDYYIEQLQEFIQTVRELPLFVDDILPENDVDERQGIVLSIETKGIEVAGQRFNEVVSNIGL